MHVIVGLGNPGKRYEQTRHNLGFLTIDYLSEDLGILVNKLKHKSLVGEGRFGRCKVLLVKPQTYMNLSGEALREIVTYYNVEPGELLVVYDDLDIPTGSLRIRKQGSAGTHNGMRSIIKCLGFNDFPRIRIGIGLREEMEFPGDMADFVTGGFWKEERKPLKQAIIKVTTAIKVYLEDGIDKAMNEYNGNC